MRDHPSFGPRGDSTESHESHGTKTMIGRWPRASVGRVVIVRTRCPRALTTDPYSTARPAICSYGRPPRRGSGSADVWADAIPVRAADKSTDAERHAAPGRRPRARCFRAFSMGAALHARVE